jgi:hypothetical protein
MEHQTIYANPYVLTKNSIDPDSTINILIDTFIVNENGFQVGRYGVPELSYRYNEGVVYLFPQDDKKEFNDLDYPNIIVSNPLYKYEPDTLFLGEENDHIQCNHDDIILEQSSNTAFYNVPWSVIFPNYNIAKADYSREFGFKANSIVENLLNGIISLTDGIEEYRMVFIICNANLELLATSINSLCTSKYFKTSSFVTLIPVYCALCLNRSSTLLSLIVHSITLGFKHKSRSSTFLKGLLSLSLCANE